jgi:predicted metal-dependent RNase
VSKKTDAFSAHADQSGLIDYVKGVLNKGDLKKVFLVHGDLENMEQLKEKLESQVEVEISKKGNLNNLSI